MKYKILGIIILLAFIFTPLLYGGTNTKAYTTITNKAQVKWNNSYSNFTFITTNVMAIYGVSQVSGPTGGDIFPGGAINLTNYITNHSNTTDLTVIITLSNFNMNAGYSGSDWRATLPNLTSQTVIGTTGSPIRVTNTLGYGEVFQYVVHIETAADVLPGDWGEIPINITTPNNLTNYTGDNGIVYGGTNIFGTNKNTGYLRVRISGPFVSLKKVLSVSNIPAYIAMGGNSDIPVPDAIITYTNYYDNDGNTVATNLVIIDTIPTHTDFVVGSITNVIYTNGSPTAIVDYADRTGTWGYTPVATGIFGEDPNVGKIRITFTGAAVGADNSNSDASDTYGIADGTIPDVDAGKMFYKVVVHRRP